MKTILNVEGMSCQHCVKIITEGLSAITGVSNVLVSLADKTVIITHDDDVSVDVLKTELDDMGYDVI